METQYTHLTTYTDVLDEAKRYLSEYDAAGAIASEDAFEEVAARAARRWRADHHYGPVDLRALDDLYALVEEEAGTYAGDTARIDGTSVGPCVARDVEMGYVWLPRSVAWDFAVDGGYRYTLTVWADGSATMECTEPGEPTNQHWVYPFGPGEAITAFEGVPQHVLEQFERVRREAITANG
jgi:hypothetical protein